MSDPNELLRARYGESNTVSVDGLHVDAVLTTLLSHRSVRAYLPKGLPVGLLETLVAAAQSASTSSNLQSFSVLAVESAERRARLAELAGRQSFIHEAPVFLAWLIDLSRLEHVARRAGVEAEGLHYLDTFLMGAIDAALASQNLVTAAEAQGLGAVYVGGLRNQPEAVARELGLPLRVFPVFGLALGYPDPDRPAEVKPRLPQTLVLHREQYAVQDIDGSLSGYDETLSGFNRNQKLPAASWSERSLERLRTVDALRGRERLREAAAALGFALR